ncbi:Alpha/Beta hydrolase protein [Fimicolochytrium jonesii]|uniref:Alpha/Beta hydrolase protein n=1 Tax=Fimicolochytrium jonesii TaxID=1396493 RepID=UPI0022FE8576|nr:Alpha/Beta hydrolase protein [Fimicolochytrium jonesii]KAI8822599.1 Alpha/Beta hydrolase protein [Fimicolochytrium jonesii]
MSALAIVTALVYLGSVLVAGGCPVLDTPTKSSHRLTKRTQYLVHGLLWDAGEKAVAEMYAGHINIRTYPDGWPNSTAPENQGKQHVANTFFWFVPALPPASPNASLVLWLQGGPGSSSMIGLLEEMGPFEINNATGALRRRKETWSRGMSLLFVDNPVGTGYSFVGAGKEGNVPLTRRLEDDEALPAYHEGYPTNQPAISRDLISFLDKFYAVFPEQSSRPLYLAGESYAGKYVPELAAAILARNAAASTSNERKLPLEGIAIGDGLTDPTTQIKAHAPLGLALGLLTGSQARVVDTFAQDATALAGSKRWVDATVARTRLFEYVANVTGGVNAYDVRKGSTQTDHSTLDRFLSREDVRRAINVCRAATQIQDGVRRVGDEGCPPAFHARSPFIKTLLTADVMKSAVPAILNILNSDSCRVLLFQGQFDFRDGPLGQTEWIENLDWDGAAGYRDAERVVWNVGDEVVGYVTEYRQLRRVVLTRAGHMAPGDQTTITRLMMERLMKV